MRSALGGCGPVVSLNRRDGSKSLRDRLFRPMTVCRAQSPSWTPCGVFPSHLNAPWCLSFLVCVQVRCPADAPPVGAHHPPEKAIAFWDAAV